MNTHVVRHDRRWQHIYTRAALAAWLALGGMPPVAAQETVLEFQYTPVARAQVALWIEDAGGRMLATVVLTEAVAFRGIGNRPGASQLNSGYRWPYGRREGVLPVWAHRRANVPGAQLFPRVIYQARPEGYAQKQTFDQSPDAYFCLQFDAERSSKAALDAVSCASVFNGDKGRYLTNQDLVHNYSEPWQESDGTGTTRILPLFSLYPPRMDLTSRCSEQGSCYDHEDVERFASDARAAMPEIDAVTRATAPGDVTQHVLFSVPSAWPLGGYRALIEVNVEGDTNARWDSARFPTPSNPANAWDSYATEYGYPYRGQPSLVYQVDFTLDATGGVYGTDTAAGRSSWEVWDANYGALVGVKLAQDDPDAISDNDGSGIDRLRRDADGRRFSVRVDAPESDAGSDDEREAVGPIEQLTLGTYPDELRSDRWVVLEFLAARSERPIHDYEVRVATEPIVDEATFISAGRPAKNATDSSQGATALTLPVATPAGQWIKSAIGDLSAQTHYYVGVRATDDQNRHGPIASAEITTTARTFATVTPCFIATAAYGSPLEPRVAALRRMRDRWLLSTAPGRQLVAAYYTLGPTAAHIITRHPRLRSLARWLILPLTAAAETLH